MAGGWIKTLTAGVAVSGNEALRMKQWRYELLVRLDREGFVGDFIASTNDDEMAVVQEEGFTFDMARLRRRQPEYADYVICWKRRERMVRNPEAWCSSAKVQVDASYT